MSGLASGWRVDGQLPASMLNASILGTLRGMKIHPASLLTALLPLLVAACAGVQVDAGTADRADASARVLRTRLESVDRAFRSIPRTDANQMSAKGDSASLPALPDPIELNFHSIAGRLAGPDAERFFRIRLKRAHAGLEAGRQDDFAFSLAALEQMLGERAKVLAARPEDAGFEAVPAEARFARLILSAGEPAYYPYFEREAGFLDTAGGDQFALVYVDRPCRITGAIRADDGVFRHELAFDTAGLHWIRIEVTGERTAKVTRQSPAGPLIVYVRQAR